MPSTQRGCRCSCETYVAVKNVTRRPILFSQLRRRDGEGAVNPEELFADDRPFQSEREREREDELRALMSSIIDWAISFLSETNQASIRVVYYEGKTVKEHSADLVRPVLRESSARLTLSASKESPASRAMSPRALSIISCRPLRSLPSMVLLSAGVLAYSNVGPAAAQWLFYID